MKKYMIMICGKSTAGKTYSLRNLKDQEGVWFFNCESGTDLPFENSFKHFQITNPRDVPKGILKAEKKPEVHTIVIDSLTFLMDMYINKCVYKAEDTRAEWGQYALFVQELFSDACAPSTKNIIFTAHTIDEVNEKTKEFETKVGCSGKKLNEKGIEAFFETIVNCSVMDIDDLEEYKNNLLTITAREERIGLKHCFQTMKTRETRRSRIRGNPMFWDDEETYIDNDVQIVVDRLRGITKPPSATSKIKAAS